jgi:Zn finger protein HypA/HybF involved in hydrogenase expression
MNEEKQRVVKCTSCDNFFGYAENSKKCPFCHTAYGEVVEDPKEPKMRKVPVKTQKDSFKIWKEDAAD